MGKFFEITGIKIDEASSPPNLPLGKKDKIERVLNDKSTLSFGSEDDLSIFLIKIKNVVAEIVAPLRRSPGTIHLIVFGAIFYFLSLPFLKWFKLGGIFARGWRLEIVKQIALKNGTPVPEVHLNSLIKYFFKGLVLFIARGIYFFPVFVVSLLSLLKVLTLSLETLFKIYEMIVNPQKEELLKFLFTKVLPEAGIEIIVQLIVLALYVVLIWPLYRVIMIQYALGKSRGFGFFNPQQIIQSFRVFRRNAGIIYGIYALVLSIDIFLFIIPSLLFLLTFGLSSLIIPVFYLFLRYWVKGYAYGYLGGKLIERSEI